MLKPIRFLILAGMGMVFLLMTGCYTSFAMTVSQSVTRTTYILEDCDDDDADIVVYREWYDYTPVYTPVPIIMPVYFDPWVRVHGRIIGWDYYSVCFDPYYRHSGCWMYDPWPVYYSGYPHHMHDWHTPYYAVWAQDDHWRHDGHRTMIERSFERRYQQSPVPGRTGASGKLAESSGPRKPRPQQRVQTGAQERDKTTIIRSSQTNENGSSGRTGNATIGRREKQTSDPRNNQNAAESVRITRSTALTSSGSVQIETNRRPERELSADPVQKRPISTESTRRNIPSGKILETPPVVSQKNQERTVTRGSDVPNIRKSSENNSGSKRSQESMRSSGPSSNHPQKSVQTSPERSSRVSAPSRTQGSSSRTASNSSGSSDSKSRSGSQNSGRRRN